LLDEEIHPILEGQLSALILTHDKLGTLKEIGSHKIINEGSVNADIREGLQHLDDDVSVDWGVEEDLLVDVAGDDGLQETDGLGLDLDALPMQVVLRQNYDPVPQHCRQDVLVLVGVDGEDRAYLPVDQDVKNLVLGLDDERVSDPLGGQNPVVLVDVGLHADHLEGLQTVANEIQPVATEHSTDVGGVSPPNHVTHVVVCLKHHFGSLHHLEVDGGVLHNSVPGEA
jgi:hypothetical protein